MLRSLSNVSSVLAFTVAGPGSGGGSPAAPPLPSPTPAPTPTPAPVATPTPEPTPTPCVYGLCEAPTTNTNPVARVNLHIFTVQDRNFELIPDWPLNKPIPVGYTIKLDVTGKDEHGQETLGNQGVNIEFFYSNPHMVKAGGNHPWQRRLLVKEPGLFQAWVIYDDVRSNTLELRFVPN
jgi:hypothetical protein